MVFLTIKAQNNNEITNDDTFSANGYGNNRQLGRSDSIQSQHKEIPRGLKVWTIDERFGDRKNVTPDTLSEMYMNLSLIHISEPTRQDRPSRMPSSA